MRAPPLPRHALHEGGGSVCARASGMELRKKGQDMNKHIIGMAVALGLACTGPALAANGSIAAAWVKDAYNAGKRLEAQKASQAACEAARGVGASCSKPELKPKVTKT